MPEELLRTGLWLERMGNAVSAEQLFRLLAGWAEAAPGQWNGLAQRDKRAGNWERAVLLWQKAAACMEQALAPTWEAHVELAMFHEHKRRDYPAALLYAEEALHLACGARMPAMPLSGQRARGSAQAQGTAAEKMRESGGAAGGILMKAYKMPGMPAPDRHIRGLLLDLDGTIYRGDHAIEGAAQLIDGLKGAGIPFKYVTNNSSARPVAVADRLLAMGIEASADDVCTSAQAAARHASELYPGGKVVLIGEDGLAAELEAAGLQLVERNADLVVQGIDREFHYSKAESAVRELLGGAAYMLTNPDLLLPSHGACSRGGIHQRDAAGSLGRRADRHRQAVSDSDGLRAGADWPGADEAWVVGDNLATDIAAGDVSGCRTILVLTGLTTADNYSRYVHAAGAEPYAVCETLSELQSYILGSLGT